LTDLTGFIPPIATPMKDGKIDRDGLDRQLDDILDHVSGVLVGGSVGEIVSLTVEERIELLRWVAERVDERHSLCFSIADNSLENTRRLADGAREADIDLLLVSAPNYFSLDVGMLEAYLAEVSDLAPADLCLYDNPAATHMQLTVADITRLGAAVERLTHVKVTDLSLGKVAALRKESELGVFAGDDAVLWSQLVEGAQGAMVALPMICPARTARFWRAFAAGDHELAFAEYAPAAVFIHAALGATDYVAVIKAAMEARGVLDSDAVRLPLTGLDPDRRAEVERSLSYLVANEG